MNQLIHDKEREQLQERPDFSVGDTVKVHHKIIEGSKERVQVFSGTVIARRGRGLSETFSVHRVAYGEGMERVFPLHSPRVVKIERVRFGKVRRAKLYYLRGSKSRKQARVRQRIVAAAKQPRENHPEAADGPAEASAE